MKVPEKPKNLRDILEKNSWQVFKLLNDETVYDFVIKCNQDHIHWDKLRYKEIPNKINPEYIYGLLLRYFAHSSLNKLNLMIGYLNIFF